eukprot:6112301-Prymnesium_polylepis.2
MDSQLKDMKATSGSEDSGDEYDFAKEAAKEVASEDDYDYGYDSSENDDDESGSSKRHKKDPEFVKAEKTLADALGVSYP